MNNRIKLTGHKWTTWINSRITAKKNNNVVEKNGGPP